MTGKDNVNTCAREEAYKYVLTQDHGDVSKFEKDLTPDIFRDFCRLGYIKQGMDSRKEERWKVTDFGRTQLRSYIDLLEQENQIADIVLAF